MLLILVLAATTVSAQIQATPIPQTVSSAFMEDFPKAKGADWHNKGREFEVSFSYFGKPYAARYHANGDMLESETTVSLVQVPNEIVQALMTDYPSFTITEVRRVTIPPNTLYAFEGNWNGRQMELHYDGEGNLMDTEPEQLDMDADGDI